MDGIAEEFAVFVTNYNDYCINDYTRLTNALRQIEYSLKISQVQGSCASKGQANCHVKS